MGKQYTFAGPEVQKAFEEEMETEARVRLKELQARSAGPLAEYLTPFIQQMVDEDLSPALHAEFEGVFGPTPPVMVAAFTALTDVDTLFACLVEFESEVFKTDDGRYVHVADHCVLTDRLIELGARLGASEVAITIASAISKAYEATAFEAEARDDTGMLLIPRCKESWHAFLLHLKEDDDHLSLQVVLRIIERVRKSLPAGQKVPEVMRRMFLQE